MDGEHVFFANNIIFVKWVSVSLLRRMGDVNVLGRDQRRVGKRKKPATFQRKTASRGRELIGDDVVILKHFLQGIDVFLPVDF